MLGTLFFAANLAGLCLSRSCYDLDPRSGKCRQWGADEPEEYYKGFTSSFSLQELSKLLHETKMPQAYGRAWDAFSYLAGRDGCPADQVREMYGLLCLPVSSRCGAHGASVSPCYNREHVWPRSWGIKGSKEGADRDLFSLFPTESRLNSKRGNHPVGDVVGTSTDPSKPRLGRCRGSPNPKLVCFEPPAAVRGDVARAILYMTTAYRGLVRGSGPVFKEGGVLEDWFTDQMLTWHELDPVDDSERFRASVAASIQGNRNPFIDHPEWARRLFGHDRDEL